MISEYPPPYTRNVATEVSHFTSGSHWCEAKTRRIIVVYIDRRAEGRVQQIKQFLLSFCLLLIRLVFINCVKCYL